MTWICEHPKAQWHKTKPGYSEQILHAKMQLYRIFDGEVIFAIRVQIFTCFRIQLIIFNRIEIIAGSSVSSVS